MPINKEEQGLELEEYRKLLADGTHSIRIGKEVPEGDVNLAYIHVPKIQTSDNISLIDTSHSSDNTIPQDQLESIVVANTQGELEYVNMISNGEVIPRPPKGTFPSQKINLTRYFKKDEVNTKNALYYRFDINYHYDSKVSTPNKDGEYELEKYTGQQIQLIDENGNIVDDTYKYDIFVQAQVENPRIYKVHIYLHDNTNKTETLKVRYNHIESVVKDEHVYSVSKQVELYSNKENTIVIDNKSRQMLEGGKLRIINGKSAYEEVSESEVQTAFVNEETEKEIFAVVPKTEGDGYKILVTQKSEADPRAKRIFSHRVIAEYLDANNKSVKRVVGHITDWSINPDALLKREHEDYAGEWKNIGLPIAGGKLRAREMVEISLPYGAQPIPENAIFSVEDDKGNLLYNVTSLTGNTQVDTQINEGMLNTLEVKANDLSEKPWQNAMQENTIIKSVPITHACTIIPERQKMKWDFKWKIDGVGKTEAGDSWTTSKNDLTIHGTGRIQFQADGSYTYLLEPQALPAKYIPEEILGFQWSKPVLTETNGETVELSLDSYNGFVVKAEPSLIRQVGRPFTINNMLITKDERIKHLAQLFDSREQNGIYSKLEIPDNVPMEEVLLRIERGVVTGVAASGNATTVNPEYRVNYRFRCERNGSTRLPVDQYKNQLGVNRLRLKSILDTNGQLFDDAKIDLVAWTTFEELESVPVFAIKVEETKKIEIEKPKVEQQHAELNNWYMRIKSGRFVKRIQLPYHELTSLEKLPEIYKAYPQLLGMVTRPDEIVEVDLEYSLPEYTNQKFHNRPFVFIDKENPIILNEYTIQTRHAPIVFESETGESFLEVYSVRSNIRKQLRISDVDAIKGIIYLHDRIREQDSIFVKYAYKEDWYTYRGYIQELATVKIVKKNIPLKVNFNVRISASVSYNPAVVTSIEIDQGDSMELAFAPTPESKTLTATVRYSDGTSKSISAAPGSSNWSSAGCNGVVSLTGSTVKAAGSGSCSVQVVYVENGITVTDTIYVKVIQNRYDIAFRLRWGYSASAMDLDFYATIDDDFANKSVGHLTGRKTTENPYAEGDNKLTLNFDYTGHREQSSIAEEIEIITVDGFVGRKITIGLRNHSNRSLSTLTGGAPLINGNLAQVEIYDRATQQIIKTVPIPTNIFDDGVQNLKICELINKGPGMTAPSDITMIMQKGVLY